MFFLVTVRVGGSPAIAPFISSMDRERMTRHRERMTRHRLNTAVDLRWGKGLNESLVRRAQRSVRLPHQGCLCLDS